jgi:hypothetical protein
VAVVVVRPGGGGGGECGDCVGVSGAHMSSVFSCDVRVCVCLLSLVWYRPSPHTLWTAPIAPPIITDRVYADAAKDYGAMQQAIASVARPMLHNVKAPDLTPTSAVRVCQLKRVGKDLKNDWEDLVRVLDTGMDDGYLNEVSLHSLFTQPPCSDHVPSDHCTTYLIRSPVHCDHIPMDYCTPFFIRSSVQRPRIHELLQLSVLLFLVSSCLCFLLSYFSSHPTHHSPTPTPTHPHHITHTHTHTHFMASGRATHKLFSRL